MPTTPIQERQIWSTGDHSIYFTNNKGVASSGSFDTELKNSDRPTRIPRCGSQRGLDFSPRSCDSTVTIDDGADDRKPTRTSSNLNSCVLCLCFLCSINLCGIIGGFLYMRIIDQRVMKNCYHNESTSPTAQALTNISNTSPPGTKNFAEISTKMELLTMILNVSDLHDNHRHLTWISTAGGESSKNVQYRDGIFKIQTSGNYLIHSKLSIFTEKEFLPSGLIKHNMSSFEHCVVILGESAPLDCNMESIFNGFKGPSHIWRMVYLTQGQRLVVKMSNKGAIYRSEESNRFQLARIS